MPQVNYTYNDSLASLGNLPYDTAIPWAFRNPLMPNLFLSDGAAKTFLSVDTDTQEVVLNRTTAPPTTCAWFAFVLRAWQLYKCSAYSNLRMPPPSPTAVERTADMVTRLQFASLWLIERLETKLPVAVSCQT